MTAADCGSEESSPIRLFSKISRIVADTCHGTSSLNTKTSYDTALASY